MPDITKNTINDYYELVSQYLFFKEYPSEDFKINECGIINEKYNQSANVVLKLDDAHTIKELNSEKKF